MKNLLLAATAALAKNLAHAVELEGFKFDDKIKLGNADLVVNGAGVRSKFGKRYVMALYLPAKATDTKAVLAAKGPKRVAISLIKDVSGSTFANAVSGGINDNSSDAEKAALRATASSSWQTPWRRSTRSRPAPASSSTGFRKKGPC
ncbi:MAG: chalcone isomerase family protein [Rhodocyclaceae bacterium]|nr:chalcone isomerase family protein [Rhodocyclaceae bacterium]